MTSVGVSVPGMTTTSSFTANFTVSGSRPSLVRNCAPASKQRRAVSASRTPPAPTIISCARCTTCEITLVASGTVKVISTIGMPPRETASAANSASSVEDTRMDGMIPTSSIRRRTSCLFTDRAPSAIDSRLAAWFKLRRPSDYKLRQTSHPDRFSKLLQRQQVGSQSLPVGKLSSSIAALSVQKIEQANRAALIRIFTDVAVLLRNLEVPRAIELNHAVVHPQPFIGVAHIGHYLAAGGFFLLLRLRDGEACACDFALIAVEDRQRDASIEGGSVDAIDV